MNLLKKIFIVSIILFGQNIYAYICVNATSNYKMFGSVLRSDILKNPFIMAFQDEQFKDYKIFYANDDTELVNQISTMTTGQCSIVLGLFTSQDCLVSGPILMKNKTIGLSSSCSDNRIAQYYPYIYTAVPKLSDFSEKIAEYTDKQNSNIIYAFYQPADIYSDTGFKAFKQYSHKTVIGIPVSSSGNFNSNLLKTSKQKNLTLIFFTYPLPSAQILVSLDSMQLINNKVEIVGASSWIFDVSVFKPIKSILYKANSVMTPSLVDQKKVNDSKFAHNFEKLYKRSPDIVEVLTYDMTRLGVECYRKATKNNKYNTQLFSSCLKTNKYQGVSGKVKFDDNLPFSDRSIYLNNFLTWV